MVREQVPLAGLTTLRVGGPARYVCEGDSLDSIRAAAALARSRGLPLHPLGQGSNVLASDAPLDAVILRMTSDSISLLNQTIIADAGYSWDLLVREAAARQWWGIENLAGIPGTVGAAPVQNIGAYGAELSDTLAWVECYDTQADAVIEIAAADCGLSYRESRFKHEPNLIITRVALHLSEHGSPNTAYADLQNVDEYLETPQAIGEAVRRIRSAKFPDLKEFGTAGSFFKNPTITAEAYAILKEQYPELPGYPNAGGVKVSLAWILDHVLSLRGFRMGRASLFQNQPLVLVTDDGATANGVELLAARVTQNVFDATGIKIEREVRSLA